MKKFVLKLFREHNMKFSKFIIIGAIYSVYTILLSTLLIDFMELPSSLSLVFAVGSAHVFKFYTYKLVRLIKHEFIKYTLINAVSLILNPSLMWLLIEIFHFPTIIATTGVMATLALFRYTLIHVGGTCPEG